MFFSSDKREVWEENPPFICLTSSVVLWILLMEKVMPGIAKPSVVAGLQDGPTESWYSCPIFFLKVPGLICATNRKQQDITF